MAKNIDLTYALRLPPRLAIGYFRSKGYTISWDWYDTWQEIHTKAFTVAKVAQLDILRDIRQELEAALAEGKTFREFQKDLTPRLKARGWWGKVEDEEGKTIQLGSPWRLRTIYNTNIGVAYQTGRWQAMEENKEARPFVQYVAVLDQHTRPSHAALHGKVFSIDDPALDAIAPPNGWGCRCRLRPLSARDVERRGLVIENTDGKLSEELQLVSKETGHMEPVAVFETRDRFGKPVRFSPDPGWSYNPGREHTRPNLDKYPAGLIDQWRAAMRERGLNDD